MAKNGDLLVFCIFTFIDLISNFCHLEMFSDTCRMECAIIIHILGTGAREKHETVPVSNFGGLK